MTERNIEVQCVERKPDGSYGRYKIEPLENGYGTTLGNALRRVLLSALPGSAVTAFRIEGISHEFTTVPGLNEDITELILNIKSIRTKLSGEGPGHMSIKTRKDQTGPLYASDIVCDAGVEIANPDLLIGTLNGKEEVSMQLLVGKGVGYKDAEYNKNPDSEIGVIAVDSIFTPIKRVNFSIDHTRVGNITDFDCLNLEVWTDGTIDCGEAISFAANHLISHLTKFTLLDDATVAEQTGDPLQMAEDQRIMNMAIEDMGFSVRTFNCLKRAGIHNLPGLLSKTEEEMMQVRNLGIKSLDELHEKLSEYGLKLADSPEEDY